MALRRRIGNLAGTLLESRLRHNEAELQNERIMQRQMEMARIQDENLRARQREERDATSEDEFYKFLQKDPRAAQRFSTANPTHKLIEKLKPFQLSAEESLADMKAGLASESDLTKLPGSREDIESLIHARLGVPAHDDSDEHRAQVDEIFGLAQGRQTGVKSALSGVKEAERGGTLAADIKAAPNLRREKVADVEALAGPEASAAAQKAGATKRAELAPDIIRAEGRRAGTIESAQQSAAWSPAIIAKKIEFEKQKGMIEAANAGNKELAVARGQKAANMSALLPQLTELRKLGNDISSAYPPNAIRDTVRAAGSTLGALPFGLGNLVTRMQERSVGPDLAARTMDKSAITKVNTYLSLRGATALAMTNAVFGNKGQTTEADRQAAEEILGSVLMNSEQRKAHDAILTRLIEDAVGGRVADTPGALAAWYEAAKGSNGTVQPTQQPGGLDPSIQRLLERGRR